MKSVHRSKAVPRRPRQVEPFDINELVVLTYQGKHAFSDRRTASPGTKNLHERSANDLKECYRGCRLSRNSAARPIAILGFTGFM